MHESELLAFEAEGIADRREAAKAASRRLGNQLAKIKKSRTPRPVDQIITEIYGGLHVKDVLCRVEGLGKSYGDKTALRRPRASRSAAATASSCSAPTAAASPRC